MCGLHLVVVFIHSCETGVLEEGVDIDVAKRYMT